MSRFRIIWAAMFATLFAYFVVMRIAPPAKSTPPPMMLPMLGLVAIVQVAFSFFLPRYLLRAGIEARKAKGAIDANGNTLAAEVQQIYFTPFVIALALIESIAIYGLLLRLVGFTDRQAYPFFVGAVLLFLLNFPTEDRVYSAFEESTGARIERSR